MPTRQSWKNIRTFRYEIEGADNEIIKSGTLQAKSVKESRTKAKQITQQLGLTWEKNWKRGWMRDAIEGTQSSIGNNNRKPTRILWVYVPK